MANENATNGFKDKFYQEKFREHDQKLRELADTMSSLKESYAVIEYVTRDLKEATAKIDAAVNKLNEKTIEKIESTVEKAVQKHTSSCPIYNNNGNIEVKKMTTKEKTIWTSVGSGITAASVYIIKLLLG